MEKLDMLREIGQMFVDYGIRSVTMDDICEHLGISKKTIYQKFKDKRDIVFQFMMIHVKEMEAFFDEIISSSDNAVVEIFELLRMIREWLSKTNSTLEYDLRKYYSDVFNKHRKTKINKIRNFYVNNYERGMREGYYRDDFDISLMVKMHLTYIISLESAGFFTRDELHSFNLYRQYFIYHIRGVASEKGLEMLNNRLAEYNL